MHEHFVRLAPVLPATRVSDDTDGGLVDVRSIKTRLETQFLDDTLCETAGTPVRAEPLPAHQVRCGRVRGVLWNVAERDRESGVPLDLQAVAPRRPEQQLTGGAATERRVDDDCLNAFSELQLAVNLRLPRCSR